jgi:hypothetical protein
MTKTQDVQVTIGRMDVMKLKDPNGVEQEIFLDMDKKRLPVPKYIYKIVTVKNDKGEDVRTVYVFNNFPLVKKEDSDGKL